jgi:hypothetical protein
MPERRDLRRNEDAMGVKFQDLTLAKGIELRTGPRGGRDPRSKSLNEFTAFMRAALNKRTR